MAYFQTIRTKVRQTPPISLGDGENLSVTPFEIKQSESSYSRNTSGQNYPALSVRQGKASAFTAVTTPWSLGQRNDVYPHIHDLYVWKRWDGAAWQNVSVYATGTAQTGAATTITLAAGSSASDDYYNGYFLTIESGKGAGQSRLITDYVGSTKVATVATWTTNPDNTSVYRIGVAGSRSRILEFNTETTRYTVFFDGTCRKAYDGSAVTDLTDAPATNLIAVDDYRLYALKDSVLYCTAEGSLTDWTTAGSADTIAITSMIGTGTAIYSYNDQIICWSEQSMVILYGDDPSNYSLSASLPDGCIADRSIVVLNGVLYFLDFGKFKSFTTGLPMEISQKVSMYLEGINNTYKNLCCAGVQGNSIFLSIPYGSATTNNLTLEYDTEHGTWYVRDDGYLDFVNIGEYLYGVDSTGALWKINSGTADGSTAITWSHITGVWYYGFAAQKKTLSDIWMIVDLPVSSTLNVSYSVTVDGNDFVSLYDFTASATEQNTRIQIPTTVLQSVDWFRLKFSGTGPCTIHYVEPYIRIRPR